MLTTEQIKQAAQLLLQAEREVKPVRQLDEPFPGIETAVSYAVLDAVVAANVAAGPRRRGRTGGLATRAMQSVQGVDEPDYGHLLDDMFYADGDRIPVERYIVPRVEAELAFILKEPRSG